MFHDIILSRVHSAVYSDTFAFYFLDYLGNPAPRVGSGNGLYGKTVSPLLANIATSISSSSCVDAQCK